VNTIGGAQADTFYMRRGFGVGFSMVMARIRV
jgi:hypothetical protein